MKAQPKLEHRDANRRAARLSPNGKCKSFAKAPNLLQYVPMGIYYARIKVRGKLLRRRLKTNAAPLSYQWRWNGADLSGLTDSSYALTSATATLTVCPLLSCAAGGALTWGGSFASQMAMNVLGPYSDVPGAQSPFTLELTRSPLREIPDARHSPPWAGGLPRCPDRSEGVIHCG